jgi:glycogen debranching enzyme
MADLTRGGLVPAFAPVIRPGDPEWRLLRHNHRFGFRNHPGRYHNGGRWAWLTGLWVAALAPIDRPAAERHADHLDAANALGPRDGSEGWGFAEFHDAGTNRPGGAMSMTWSAAGTVIARRALSGSFAFPGS